MARLDGPCPAVRRRCWPTWFRAAGLPSAWMDLRSSAIADIRPIFLAVRDCCMLYCTKINSLEGSPMRLSPVLLFAGVLLARPAMADALDDAMLAEMKRAHIPGVNLLVLKDGKVIKEKGYGLANIEHNVAVTPSTVFQSGSIGKTFTAALILLLAEDGKLKLDDPISQHLAGTPQAWKGITIRHL